MRHALLPAVPAVLLLAQPNTQAAAAELTGEAIRRMVSGATVAIETPLGSVPVRYATDGGLNGEARSAALFLGSGSDQGRWWVAGDQLCHKWRTWFDAEPHCLKLSGESGRLVWRLDNGRSGMATIVARGKPPAASEINVARRAERVVFDRETGSRSPAAAPVAAASAVAPAPAEPDISQLQQDVLAAGAASAMPREAEASGAQLAAARAAAMMPAVDRQQEAAMAGPEPVLVALASHAEEPAAVQQLVTLVEPTSSTEPAVAAIAAPMPAPRATHLPANEAREVAPATRQQRSRLKGAAARGAPAGDVSPSPSEEGWKCQVISSCVAG